MDINDRISSVKEQIDRFDNKASILIGVVGIVFAISLGVMDVFNRLAISNAQVDRIKWILLLIFTVLYFISFAVVMVFLVLVIFPRKKKNDKMKSISYYMDISRMTVEEVENNLLKAEDDAEIDQLIINATICTQKHKCLIRAIWTLVPMFAFVVAMFFTAIVS